MKKLKAFLVAFFSGLATAAGIILAVTVRRKSRAENWGAYPGDDTKAIAEAPDGSTVTVDLPPGKTIKDVKNIYVGAVHKAPKVRVLHDAKDRRDIPADIDTDHDMGL